MEFGILAFTWCTYYVHLKMLNNREPNEWENVLEHVTDSWWMWELWRQPVTSPPTPTEQRWNYHNPPSEEDFISRNIPQHLFSLYARPMCSNTFDHFKCRSSGTEGTLVSYPLFDLIPKCLNAASKNKLISLVVPTLCMWQCVVVLSFVMKNDS